MASIKEDIIFRGQQSVVIALFYMWLGNEVMNGTQMAFPVTDDEFDAARDTAILNGKYEACIKAVYNLVGMDEYYRLLMHENPLLPKFLEMQDDSWAVLSEYDWLYT